jgi:hypothetical protein
MNQIVTHKAFFPLRTDTFHLSMIMRMKQLQRVQALLHSRYALSPLILGAEFPIMNERFGSVAQLAEQLTLNQLVVGSSPTGVTISLVKKKLCGYPHNNTNLSLNICLGLFD